MRSEDFSLAPAPGPAGAMFVGATLPHCLKGMGGAPLPGPRAILAPGPGRLRTVREMKPMRGYVWHKVYGRFPFTLGTIAFFTDRGELLKSARGRAHHELMCWLTDEGEKRVTGGWIRICTADAAGYTNGLWRAENGRLGHIYTFSPLSTEHAPRAVRHVTR